MVLFQDKRIYVSYKNSLCYVHVNRWCSGAAPIGPDDYKETFLPELSYRRFSAGTPALSDTPNSNIDSNDLFSQKNDSSPNKGSQPEDAAQPHDPTKKPRGRPRKKVPSRTATRPPDLTCDSISKSTPNGGRQM